VKRPGCPVHSAANEELSKAALSVAEVVQLVLVEPEIVGQLVEDGHPDLVLELAHYFGIDEDRLDELGYG